MAPSPKIVFPAFFVYALVYTVTCCFPTACDMYWGTGTCTETERWFISTFSMFNLLTAFQVLALHMAAPDDEKYNRRLAVFLAYAFSTIIGAWVMAGNKKFGGIFVPEQFVPGLVLQMVWMFVLAAMIRADGGELQAPVRSPFDLSTPMMKAWFVSFFAMFYWLFDGTSIGGTVKYLTINLADVTPGAHTAMQFFMICIVLNLFNLMFAATYASFKQMRLYFVALIICNVVFEVYFRFLQPTPLMKPDALLEGSVMRVVIIGSLAWGLQAQPVEDKGLGFAPL